MKKMKNDEWLQFASEFSNRIIDEAKIKITMSEDKKNCAIAIVTSMVHACAAIVINVVEPVDHEKIVSTFREYLERLPKD